MNDVLMHSTSEMLAIINKARAEGAKAERERLLERYNRCNRYQCPGNDTCRGEDCHDCVRIFLFEEQE